MHDDVGLYCFSLSVEIENLVMFSKVGANSTSKYQRQFIRTKSGKISRAFSV